MNDTFALHDTNMQVANLDTRLVQRIFPTFKPPRHGIVNGHAKLAGGQHALDVDGDITFDERRSGRSRVVALGRVGFGPGVFNATNLRLTLRPLQVDLAKEFAPTLPIGGTLTGTATLNGSTTSRMVARGDITHVDRGAVSQVTGTGAFRMGRGITFANTWMDVDARLHPLSLVTVGRFAPTMGLRGSATGPIRLTGTMRDLAVRSDLAFPDGGTASITGKLDLASVQKGYDVTLKTELFNANTIIAKAPRTSVTGTATAVGRGIRSGDDECADRRGLSVVIVRHALDRLGESASLDGEWSCARGHARRWCSAGIRQRDRHFRAQARNQRRAALSRRDRLASADRGIPSGRSAGRDSAPPGNPEEAHHARPGRLRADCGSHGSRACSDRKSAGRRGRPSIRRGPFSERSSPGRCGRMALRPETFTTSGRQERRAVRTSSLSATPCRPSAPTTRGPMR